MTRCLWQSEDPPDEFSCTRCGRTMPRAGISVLPYNRTCTVQVPRGLGDWLAQQLIRVGIRKRYGCGCGRRQETLNRAIPFDWFIWKWRLFWPLLWVFRRR